MQVNYKLNDKCSLTMESKDMKQVFDLLAYADSIFKIAECGNCGSKNLRFDVRNPKGYIYRSLVCNECRHTLKISEQKPENGGRLYPDKEWMEPYDGGNDDSGSSRRGSNRDDSDYDEPETVGAGRSRGRPNDGIDF